MAGVVADLTLRVAEWRALMPLAPEEELRVTRVGRRLGCGFLFRLDSSSSLVSTADSDASSSSWYSSEEPDSSLDEPPSDSTHSCSEPLIDSTKATPTRTQQR